MNVRMISTGVEDDNETALHIYSKLGFTRFLGRKSGEYQGDAYEYGLFSLPSELQPRTMEQNRYVLAGGPAATPNA